MICNYDTDTAVKRPEPDSHYGPGKKKGKKNAAQQNKKVGMQCGKREGKRRESKKR